MMSFKITVLALLFLILPSAVSVKVIQDTQSIGLQDNEYYCGNKPADVVFLLDTSNSIWDPHFEKELDFVKNVVSMFDIRDNTTRIGVATFARGVTKAFHLNKFSNTREVLGAIGSIRRSAGDETNTARAISYMWKNMFTPRHGSRPGVAKVGIVLTDGKSSRMLMTVLQAARAKRRGIHMFSIGIGSRTNKRELRMIASKPFRDYYFEVNDFYALNSLKKVLAVRTCQVTPKPTTTTTTTTTTPAPTTTTTTTTPAPTTTTTTPTTTTTSILELAKRVCERGVSDLVFAFDSTTRVNYADFRKQIEFAKQVTDNLNIRPNGTRVGAILYSDQIVNILNLNDRNGRADIKGALDKVEKSAGRNRIDLAIKFIHTKSFRRGLARKRAAQVAIIFTASPALYMHRAKKQAEKARESGIALIPISIGNIGQDDMRAIAGTSDGSKYYELSSFDQLDSFIGEVALEACRVPEPVIPISDQSCGSRQEADIMFILDSLNMGKKNTKRVMMFIKELINEVDVHPNKIQVGLMSAECQEDYTGFSLNSNTNKVEVANALSKVKAVDFSHLLKDMRRGAYSQGDGGRREAKKVAILIVDGSLEEPIRALTEAQRARIHGIEVIVIQVGQEEPQEELLMMCDAPRKQHFFTVPNYNALQSMKDKLWQTLCDEL